MGSRFREKLNQSYCLARMPGEGWVAAKKVGKKIFVDKEGKVTTLCLTNDMGMYKHFSESREYASDKIFVFGEKVILDEFGPYFVVDAGFRDEDGTAKYLIAR